MFVTKAVGSIMTGWKVHIYEHADEPTNTLLAVVFGYSEEVALARTKAVFEALQALEK